MKHPQWITDSFHKRDWFDDGMIVFWSAIWLAWLVAAVGEFFGTEVVSVARGDLIISRGIGPLRRTFRYPIGEIAELVSDGPANDEQAKPRLHHILLQPKTGAVRFAWRGKTVCFADWLDEDEGAQIVRWLRPKLPQSAMEPLPYEFGGTANFRP